MIKVPGKDATPEDKAKFNKAIGVPETVEGYKFDIGREPTDADKAIQGSLAKIALDNGIPAPAMTALSKAVAELATAAKAKRTALLWRPVRPMKRHSARNGAPTTRQQDAGQPGRSGVRRSQVASRGHRVLRKDHRQRPEARRPSGDGPDARQHRQPHGRGRVSSARSVPISASRSRKNWRRFAPQTPLGLPSISSRRYKSADGNQRGPARHGRRYRSGPGDLRSRAGTCGWAAQRSVRTVPQGHLPRQTHERRGLPDRHRG
jgi:hypothetical protein